MARIQVAKGSNTPVTSEEGTPSSKFEYVDMYYSLVDVLYDSTKLFLDKILPSYALKTDFYAEQYINGDYSKGDYSFLGNREAYKQFLGVLIKNCIIHKLYVSKGWHCVPGNTMDELIKASLEIKFVESLDYKDLYRETRAERLKDESLSEEEREVIEQDMSDRGEWVTEDDIINHFEKYALEKICSYIEFYVYEGVSTSLSNIDKNRKRFQYFYHKWAILNVESRLDNNISVVYPLDFEEEEFEVMAKHVRHSTAFLLTGLSYIHNNLDRLDELKDMGSGIVDIIMEQDSFASFANKEEFLSRDVNTTELLLSFLQKENEEIVNILTKYIYGDIDYEDPIGADVFKHGILFKSPVKIKIRPDEIRDEFDSELTSYEIFSVHNYVIDKTFGAIRFALVGDHAWDYHIGVKLDDRNVYIPNAVWAGELRHVKGDITKCNGLDENGIETPNESPYSNSGCFNLEVELNIAFS